MKELDDELGTKAEYHRKKSTQHEALANLAYAWHAIGWHFDDPDELAEMLGESMVVKIGDQVLAVVIGTLAEDSTAAGG